MCFHSMLLFISLLPLLCYNLEISTPPTDRTARLGSNLSFSCLIQQTPDLTQPYKIEWLFNGNILNLAKPSSGVARRSSLFDTPSLTSTLFLTEIIWNDSGEYSCQLSVSNGSFITSDSAHLEIATLAETFLTNPESKSPMVGEGPVYLFCSHGNSVPPASITWLKNSLFNSLSFTTTIINVGSMDVTSSTLTISQATPSDIGAYTCEATSSYFPGVEVRSDTALLMVGSETSFPVWLQHPHEEAVLAINIGAELVLTCTVFGNPSPSVTWEKDGSDLATSNEVTLSTGIQSSYNVAVFSHSDIGSYRCRALNIHGSTYSNTVELRLAFLEDNFIQEPEDTIIFEGQEAFLRCMPPSSLPPAVVTWTRDDELIQGDGYDITTDGHLVIISADFVDTGVYGCVSTNPLINNYSISSQTAYLLVASPIELTISSELVQTLVDSEVVITCSDTGVPTPSISWTRGTVDLPNSLYPGITINGNQLSILNVLLAHEGYFQCTAVNEVETQFAEVFVDVIQPPIVTAVIPSITTREGLQSILTCSAAGDPEPVIDWMKEGDSSISLSTIHSVYSNGSLVISYTERSDAGNYICRGTNVGGEDEDIIALNVHFPPFITSQLQDQLIPPGDSVSLLCTAEANPAPQFYWEGPNGTIPDSSSGMLSLTNIQSDAEGEYTCIASNYIYTVSFKIQIIVTAPPEVSIIGGTQSVIEGQSTSIQCQIISGNPVPQISWFRDNQMLTSSQDSISITLSNQISTLSISPALRSDTNNYTCRGSNVAGSSESYVLINVFSPPDPPQIIFLFPLPSSPPSPDTTSLYLNWTIEEDGGSPVLSYVIRYTALLATPSLTQEVVVEATPRELIIDLLVPYTTYEVQIYARNLIGVSTFSDPDTIRSLILYPSVPRGIELSSPGPYTLTSSWEEPVPANGPVAFYEIQYQLFTTVQTSNQIEFLEVSGDVFTANLTGLMPQSAYSVSIRAKNRDEQGNLLIGPFSQVILGDTGFQAPSNPPTIVSVIATSSESIEMNWIPADVDIAAPVTSYIIFIVSVSQVIPPAPTSIQISALFNSTEIIGLFPYSQYLVSMASSNSKGYSSPGGESSVTTEEDIPTSPAVNITIFLVESTVIGLSWEDPDFLQVRGEIIRYDIHYKRTDENREFDIIRATTKNAMITGLNAYTEYDVSVAIVTGKGSGPRNEPPLVQRTAEGLPTAPTGLAADTEDTSARLDWNQPSSIKGLLQEYTITIQDIISGDILVLTLPTTNMITEPYLHIDGIIPGSNYTFYVMARTGAGTGASSEVEYFSTTGTRPTTPPPLTVTVIVTVPVTVTTASTTQVTTSTTQVTDNTTQSTPTTITTETATQTEPVTNTTTNTSSTPAVTNSTTDTITTQSDTTSQSTPTTQTTTVPGQLPNFASILIPAVIIVILLILLVLVLICVGVYAIRNQEHKVKARALKIRGLTDSGRGRSSSLGSARRPHSLTLSNPYHAISRGAASSRNPQSERSWYTSVRSPTKSDTMDTLQGLVVEKERQIAGAGNLFTPYGYIPPALGGEPTPSPAGMSKLAGQQTAEVISNDSYSQGVNVDRERKQLSSPKQSRNEGGFNFDKLSPKKSKDMRLDTSGGSDPPSLPPRRYQEEPSGIRYVLDEVVFDDLEGEPERDEDFRM